MPTNSFDFLAGLAARSRGAPDDSVPIVRPRAPSRFEPARPSDDIAMTEVANEVARSSAVDHGTTEPANLGLLPSSNRAAESATLPSSERSTPEAARAGVPRTLEIVERAIRERETRTIRVIERERAVPADARHSKPNAMAVPTPTPQRGSAPARAPEQPAPPRAVPLRPPSPPAPILAPPTRKAPTANPPDAPVDRDIHITIGRLEVRASVPARRSAPARASAPAVDLEQYLSARDGSSANGGGR